MGNSSGIKWNGVSVGTQPTLDVIGANVQLILRDPKTQQEWVTTSQDYANFLVDNGIISSGGWGLTGNAGTDPLTNFIGTTDNTDFIIQPDAGNVGIGTASPTYKLDIVGKFHQMLDSGGGNITDVLVGNGDAGFLVTDGVDSTEVHINPVGVGIGTISPTEKLHINGSVFTHNLTSFGYTEIIQNNGGYEGIELHANDTINGYDTYIRLMNSGIELRAHGSQVTTLAVYPETILLGIGSTDKVGIGAYAPTSKLTVDTGDIEVVGDTNGVILESPDGTRYRVTVANGGTLSVTAV